MDGTIKAGAVFPTHSLASVTDFQVQSDMLQGIKSPVSSPCLPTLILFTKILMLNTFLRANPKSC